MQLDMRLFCLGLKTRLYALRVYTFKPSPPRYACGKSMGDRAFYDADGDLLVVPELGALHVQTEFGKLCVRAARMLTKAGTRISCVSHDLIHVKQNMLSDSW